MKKSTKLIRKIMRDADKFRYYFNKCKSPLEEIDKNCIYSLKKTFDMLYAISNIETKGEKKDGK